MANAGIIHQYNPRLVAFEHASPQPAKAESPPNTLLWIGGLGDGLLTVKYPRAIVANLPSDWVLAEVLISSSYKGWASGSLERDVRELAQCVKYFKELRPNRKVVLMGHSTGCQDAMEYTVGKGHEERTGLDGIILQGGVSDREAWTDFVSQDAEQKAKFDALKADAKKLVEEGKGKEVMTREGNIVAEEFSTAMSAYRTHSLLSEGGDDDYFSFDLPDETLARTFGKIPKTTPVMVLLGDADPFVPASIDKIALVQRWSQAIQQGGGAYSTKGGVVPKAQHSMNDDPPEVVQDLVNRVISFLKSVDSGAVPDEPHL